MKPGDGRVWNDFKFMPVEERAASLNANEAEAVAEASTAPSLTCRGMGASGSGGNLADEEEDGGDADVDAVLTARRMAAAAAAAGGGAGGGLTAWLGRTHLSTLTGNKLLERSDIEPVLDELRASLANKNVAAEVLIQVCEAVGAVLLGTRVRRRAA